MIFHYKNKNSIIFRHLRSKLTSEMSESREFSWKTKQNRFKVSTLPTFFQKTTTYLWKNDKRLSIPYCKNKPTKFMYLLSSEICQKVVSLDLRTALKRWSKILASTFFTYFYFFNIIQFEYDYYITYTFTVKLENSS